MDYKNALLDAAQFTHDTVWGYWKRWFILAVWTIIFPLLGGYVMDIFRGNSVPPDCNDWVRRFIDGIKYLVAGLIYSIPVIIVLVITFIPVFMEFINQVTSETTELNFDAFLPLLMPVIGGVIVAIILGIIVTLLFTIGIIRMARTNRFLEVFNFSEILKTIGKIGWGTYIIALIIIYVISFILGMLINLIIEAPYIGIIIALFLWPLVTIFESRYFTLLYEESGE
ncbi:DUF4013 domain-containing protein [Methanospirillum sp. J.3.6.1-F.2.7.3]|jgi:hypothetical protein|uniref:DUF4013 domain-containing protein n=2 Tax=Methanospirillum TaxID=2202 RepID=A0A8E7AU86_9EURY|nr:MULTISPECIES: DUF4013 domain-containing protein [Methanospirillum]MDX8551659.1 DUF4013 domain-containing protein [Methanospirillum hungatei]QVV87652.1 DUF4013 domain-containing protein [Methanospirillum sp. J.3.6.1-F.2.7.3]QXO95206.1 DUF4013 domain-containing protein [Methanospirillum hungatei]